MVDNQRRSQAHRNRIAGQDAAVTEPPSDAMTLWLSADAVEGLTDGESINGATIPDLSGNSRDFTGNLGTYEEDELNGYPVLQNLAGTNLMLRAAVAIRDIFGLNACSIYGIFYLDGAVQTRLVYEASNHLTINWRWTGNIHFTHQDGLGAGLALAEAIPPGWVSAFHLLECWRDGADGEITYDDGSLLIAETDTDENLEDVTDTLQIFPVCIGKFAELITYDRALNAAERQQVRDYLGAKYALF
jgi:hypothetical protein